jgi:hypothetical protein
MKCVSVVGSVAPTEPEPDLDGLASKSRTIDAYKHASCSVSPFHAGAMTTSITLPIAGY